MLLNTAKTKISPRLHSWPVKANQCKTSGQSVGTGRKGPVLQHSLASENPVLGDGGGESVTSTVRLSVQKTGSPGAES